MNMNMRSWYKAVAVTVATSSLGISVQAQNVVYDASKQIGTTLVQSFYSTNEFGDQIKLAGAGPLDRTIGQFKFEYYLSRLVTGNEKVTLRIYDNTGANGQPNNLLWDSGAIALNERTGYQTLVVNNPTDASGNALTVPDWITWTVSFAGIEGNESVGLLLRDTPTIGEDYTDYWDKTPAGWQTKIIQDTPVTFGAQVVAVPEPTTIQLGLLGALGLLGSLAVRRRSSK
jgi:MYXO-CTERM domain-containing protein